MQFNDQKSIKNLLQNLSKSQPQKQSQEKSYKKNLKKKNQIIRNNDFFFKNEVFTQQKIQQIPDFYKRYYLFQDFSPLKIGEFNKEQQHLENYEDISDQLHLWTFKTPTLSAVMNDKSDADWALQMPNGVKKIYNTIYIIVSFFNINIKF